MMDIARLLFARSAAQASGILYVHSRSGVRRVELFQGWVHAIDAGAAAPAKAEAQLRYILRLRAPADFNPSAAMPEFRTIPPFHPAPSIRNHVEAQNLSVDELRRTIGQQRIAMTMQPPITCIGSDERALLGYLSKQHTLREVEFSGICPPLRTVKLLVFLHAIGCLTLYAAPHPLLDTYALLGLAPGATAEQIKSAYRRLARQLHPDIHPSASPAERAALATKFAAIHAAYRKLSGT
jgi:hypothetical protein